MTDQTNNRLTNQTDGTDRVIGKLHFQRLLLLTHYIIPQLRRTLGADACILSDRSLL